MEYHVVRHYGCLCHTEYRYDNLEAALLKCAHLNDTTYLVRHGFHLFRVHTMADGARLPSVKDQILTMYSR